MEVTRFHPRLAPEDLPNDARMEILMAVSVWTNVGLSC